MSETTVIVAGGGASGALLASAIVRRSPNARAIVVEPRDTLGTGMAYSTECPLHLLNVPAARMSALAGDPDHFVRWLSAECPATYGAHAFVPRSLYGRYLHSVTKAAQASAGSRFQHVCAFAREAAVEASGVSVRCSDGQTLRGDALVVALGNASPAPWPEIFSEGTGAHRIFPSAWHEGALRPEDPDDTVVLIGTGLTAVDAVLGLRHNGHRGVAHMVSRRGLLPHEHRLFDAAPQDSEDADTLRDLLSAARRLTRSAKEGDEDWRDSLDRIRPGTNRLWQALTVSEQRRFMRHVLPYWNIHRHRMAPEIVRALADLISSGNLRMLAGRAGKIEAEERSLRVPIVLRGNSETLTVHAQRVINCSGPTNDVRKLENELIQSLLREGLMAPSPIKIGIAVAPNGALIDAQGQQSTRIFTIGPVRFGTLIETTAIPEIRTQVSELAEVLTRSLTPNRVAV